MSQPSVRIDPDGLYTGEQAEAVLKGFIGLETLRKKGGLRGLPNGYFGSALLSALHVYCGTIWAERGPCSSGKENEHGTIFEKADHLENKRLAPCRLQGELESNGKDKPIHSSPGGGEVETLVSDYNRLREEAKATLVSRRRSESSA